MGIFLKTLGITYNNQGFILVFTRKQNKEMEYKMSAPS